MGERMKQRANKDGLAMAGPPKYVCPVHSMQNVRKDLSAYPAHPKAKRVLVVGGGPGGLQAAITAAERGHQVTLCEKAPALGGLMRYTDIDPFKADLQYKKDQLIRQAKEAGILSALICDAGMTEFHGEPTYTCLAFEPRYPDEVDPITGALPLF